jgi:YidC/Oxa1 family membrane protein insertase
MMNNKDQMHPDDKKNLITFIVFAALFYFSFDYFVLKPKMDALREAQQIQTEQGGPEGNVAVSDVPVQEVERPRDVVLQDSPRLIVDNGAIMGSMALMGGRLDDIKLLRHFKTMEKKENVVLFSPAGSAHPKYVEFGWVAGDKTVDVPGRDTLWRVRGDSPDVKLAKGSPVTLFWDNGAGLLFERTLEIDENYLVNVKQSVVNNTGRKITIFPYALISQHGMAEDFSGRWVVHEGPIGYMKDELIEKSYKSISNDLEETFEVSRGWIGVSEKYWFSSLIPVQGKNYKYRYIYKEPKSDNGKEVYQVDILGGAEIIEPGGKTDVSTNVFAGAKDLRLLEGYEETLDVPHFDLAVDFGLYYFITKPFAKLLTFFAGIFGNFGISIICLTIIVRAAVFPLANTSFRSFAKMREIAPQMTELRERYSDDRVKLQEGLVKLYEKEKVNPMSGCFPILIQIPIFFALFKTLSVTLEMRHAPFFGWVQDLSAQDPTTVFNLFGLLPYDVPGFLMIGAWPCAMLFFMIMQRKMNPPPQDKMQAMMINYMPYFITYMLSKFPAGLVIYWTFSNALSVVQQYVIMRSMGVEVHFFKKSEDDQHMEDLVKEGPSVHPELGVIEDTVEEAMFDDDDVDGAAKEQDVKPISAPKPKKKKKKRK